MNTTSTTTPVSQKRSSRRVVAASTGAALAIAGICGAAVFAFTPSSHASTTGQSTPAATVVHPGSAGTHGGSAVKPSASIKTLQQKLGDLNYYNGPIDGIAGPQTTAAIKYLQRDAHLPQTGVMNQATTNAMNKMLISGNNVMGAN